MTEVIQPTDLKIGIDGVAKPVTRVISEVEALRTKKNDLVEQINRTDPEDKGEIDKLQRQLNHIDFRIDHFQQPLDIQFPHYTPSPTK